MFFATHWIWFSICLHAAISMRLANVRRYEAYPEHNPDVFDNDVLGDDIHGNVYIYAKVEETPFASKITSVNDKCVNIQIEKGGKINEKLVEFIAEILGVRKQIVLLTKGFFEQEKILLLDKCPLSALEVEAKLRDSIPSL